MEWFEVLSIIALGICLVSCLFHFVRLIRLGNPTDYAVRAGDTTKAVSYSFTGAMSPAKKESAYLHLPTYTAGILYHLGTFLSILIFFLFLAGVKFSSTLSLVVAIFISTTTISGLMILVKRIIKPSLSSLSNPDDYISNILVTLFQALTAAFLLDQVFEISYFVSASVLLIYLPLGKLKHAIYFFAARYHLGYYFGYRGTWPPIKNNS
jgi:nitrate reductase gamma subunit